jgi:hypothetical protein
MASLICRYTQSGNWLRLNPSGTDSRHATVFLVKPAVNDEKEIQYRSITRGSASHSMPLPLFLFFLCIRLKIP